MKKLSFKVKKGEEELELAVQMPTTRDENIAEMEQSRVFGMAIDNGVRVAEALNNALKEQGLWNDEKEKELEEIYRRLRENELKLKSGKDGEKHLRKIEGKEIAVQMINDRAKVDELTSVRTRMLSYTAEGMAQNAKFNCLVSLCTVYNDGRGKYFKSLEDYKNRANDEDAETAAQKFYELYYGFKDDPRKEYPEYKFLLKYGFVNDKLMFLNEQGKTVTMDGKFLLREDGRYVNEQNQLINASGQLVDENGDIVVESVEFLD